RAGAVYEPAGRMRRPGDPSGGVVVLSRPWRAGADGGLGPDAARRRRGIRLDGAMDRRLSGCRDRAHRFRFQSVRRRASRCPRSPLTRSLNRRFSQVATPLIAKSKMWKFLKPPWSARLAYVSFSG